MLPLFFCEQGSSAPVGHNGGITMKQAFPTTDGWTATAWYGGTNLGSFTQTNMMDAYQRAIIVARSYWVDVADGNTADPDN